MKKDKNNPFYLKMLRSLGNKRNELSDDHIKELVRLYAEHEHNGTSQVLVDGKPEQRVCSKVFDNRYRNAMLSWSVGW